MGAEGGRNSGQGLAQWEQSPCHSGSFSDIAHGRRKSCAKNEWLAEPGVGGCAIQAGCLRREDHFFPFPPTVESGWATFFHPSIVPSCGIFPHTRSHLTNFEAIPESGDVRARSLRLRLKDGSGRDDACRQGEVWGA